MEYENINNEYMNIYVYIFMLLERFPAHTVYFGIWTISKHSNVMKKLSSWTNFSDMLCCQSFAALWLKWAATITKET